MSISSIRSDIHSLKGVVTNDPNMTRPENQHLSRIVKILDGLAKEVDDLDDRVDSVASDLDSLERKVADLE